MKATHTNHSRRVGAAFAVAFAPLALAACPEPVTPVVPHSAPSASPSASASGSVAPDPLGPMPAVKAPAAFLPPSAVVTTGPNGLAVWHQVRDTVPLVTLAIVFPTGSASDPPGQAGLTHVLGKMLQAGAGDKKESEFAEAVEELGATFTVRTDADSLSLFVTVLRKNAIPAAKLLASAVMAPRFDPPAFTRAHGLWLSSLATRAKDPDEVARVVMRRALYGDGHPYAHPWAGSPDSAGRVTLADVRAHARRHLRPDRATFVVAGDLSTQTLAAELVPLFAGWTVPTEPPPAPPTFPPYPELRPRFIVVDRPSAPQSVIGITRPGVTAESATYPDAGLVNTVLGGSFTSRLNASLREKHGWTYGARSHVATTRGPGAIVAWSSVDKGVTADALRELRRIMIDLSEAGLTSEEADKSRAQARSDLIDAFETTEGIAARSVLAAGLGLNTLWETRVSQRRAHVPLSELRTIAARYLDPRSGTIVVVGPLATIRDGLLSLGLGNFEQWDEEGRPVRTR